MASSPQITATSHSVQASHSLQVDTPTFFYLPHCPRSVFEQLLRANWSPNGLVRPCIQVFSSPSFPCRFFVESRQEAISVSMAKLK